MKQHSEKRTEAAVMQLLKTLKQNLQDTGKILDEYESEHTETECWESRMYSALVAGHFAMEDAINTINERLNK